MTYGLVLSGGGVRGIMHLGVIKALEEFGIRPGYISGTSAGSIIGSFYSYGYSPDEILDIIVTTSFFKSIRPAWTWAGLLSLEGLSDILLRHIPENNFDALRISMTVAATDLNKGKAKYFSEGELIPAILASCCIPGIFKPFPVNGSVYVDGGILDNLPVKPIKDKCDFIIGSHCNPIDNYFDKNNLKAIIERSLLMAINGNTTGSKVLCNVLIEPPAIGKISGYELARAKEIFDIGYSYAMSNFKAEDFKPS